MNRYLIEIAAEMQIYENISELSRERQYLITAKTQEEAEQLALIEDRKHYGENRIVIFSAQQI